MNNEKNSVETKSLSIEKQEELLGTLKERFERNMARHKGIEWEDVKKKIMENKENLIAIYEMEETGGEPDVVAFDNKIEGFTFLDCSVESPKGRRSVCYDREALEGRKENKPKNNAIDMAMGMGIEILTEDQYKKLQEFGKFDIKTSSWVKTPEAIRKLGGALFCDCRYDTVFTYHNGAESYYSARGFRGFIVI